MCKPELSTVNHLTYLALEVRITNAGGPIPSACTQHSFSIVASRWI